MTGDALRAEVQEAMGGRTDFQSSIEARINATIRDISTRKSWTWAMDPVAKSVAIVAGNSTADFETIVTGGVIEFITLYLDTGKLAGTGELIKRTSGYFWKKWAALAYLPQGYPEDYAVTDKGTIVFAPRSDGSYNLRAYVIPGFSDITNFALALTYVPVDYHEKVKHGVLARCFAELTAEMDKATAWAQAYEVGVKQMIDEDDRDPKLIIQAQLFLSGNQSTVPRFDIDYWASPFVVGLR